MRRIVFSLLMVGLIGASTGALAARPEVMIPEARTTSCITPGNSY